ncbi:hypothetical protein V6N11_051349 [Hibiscus sabdariffa]|uniref:RNase H type-1 domain-containing protein n=1 Tax=Hibiscus sabdariffa TaxID=183260 RepID=A0ABR2AA89_9ROSI
MSYIKINTDGAYNPSTHDAMIGVIAHENKGMLLGGIVQNSANILDALHVDFFAILADHQLARDRGWRSIVIEFDSTIIVNKFNQFGSDLSVLGSQVENGFT